MKYFSVSVEFIINSHVYRGYPSAIPTYPLYAELISVLKDGDIFIEWPIYLFVKPFDQNFVGLSISDGYIATGSETNEVCIP